MTSYPNNSLDKLCKQDLILIVLSLQTKLDEANNEGNNKVLEEVRNLSDTITKPSSELSIQKMLIPCYQANYLPWSDNAGQILSIQDKNIYIL